MSERDLLLAQAITELGDARRDAVRLAESAQATLDRVIGARYDRPATASRPLASARPSPIDASDEYDTDFLRGIGVAKQNPEVTE